MKNVSDALFPLKFVAAVFYFQVSITNSRIIRTLSNGVSVVLCCLVLSYRRDRVQCKKGQPPRTPQKLQLLNTLGFTSHQQNAFSFLSFPFSFFYFQLFGDVSDWSSSREIYRTNVSLAPRSQNIVVADKQRVREQNL